MSMAGVGTRGSADGGWPGLSRSPTRGLRLLGPVGLGGSGRLGQGPGGLGRLPLTWGQPVRAQPRAGPQHPGQLWGKRQVPASTSYRRLWPKVTFFFF